MAEMFGGFRKKKPPPSPLRVEGELKGATTGKSW